jgi:hypothetical protein
MPAENECEEQSVLMCPPCEGHEEGAARPTEGPARPSLKRKGLDGDRVCCEDEPTKDVTCSPPHRLSSADYSLCRQVVVPDSRVGNCADSCASRIYGTATPDPSPLDSRVATKVDLTFVAPCCPEVYTEASDVPRCLGAAKGACPC